MTIVSGRRLTVRQVVGLVAVVCASRVVVLGTGPATRLWASYGRHGGDRLR